MIDPTQQGAPPAMMQPPAPPMGPPGAMATDPSMQGAPGPAGQFPSLDPNTAIAAVMQMAGMDKQQFMDLMAQAAQEFDAKQAEAISAAAQVIQRMFSQPPPETLNAPAGTESAALAPQGGMDPSQDPSLQGAYG